MKDIYHLIHSDLGDVNASYNVFLRGVCLRFNPYLYQEVMRFVNFCAVVHVKSYRKYLRKNAEQSAVSEKDRKTLCAGYDDTVLNDI